MSVYSAYEDYSQAAAPVPDTGVEYYNPSQTVQAYPGWHQHQQQRYSTTQHSMTTDPHTVPSPTQAFHPSTVYTQQTQLLHHQQAAFSHHQQQNFRFDAHLTQPVTQQRPAPDVQLRRTDVQYTVPSQSPAAHLTATQYHAASPAAFVFPQMQQQQQQQQQHQQLQQQPQQQQHYMPPPQQQQQQVVPPTMPAASNHPVHHISASAQPQAPSSAYVAAHLRPSPLPVPEQFASAVSQTQQQLVNQFAPKLQLQHQAQQPHQPHPVESSPVSASPSQSINYVQSATSFQPLHVQIPQQQLYSAPTQPQENHQRRLSYEQPTHPQYHFQSQPVDGTNAHQQQQQQHYVVAQYSPHNTSNHAHSPVVVQPVQHYDYHQQQQQQEQQQQHQQQHQQQMQQQYQTPEAAQHPVTMNPHQLYVQPSQVETQEYSFRPSRSYSLSGALDFVSSGPATTRTVSGSSSATASVASPSVGTSTSPTIANVSSPHPTTGYGAPKQEMVSAMDVKMEPLSSSPVPITTAAPTDIMGYPSSGYMYAMRTSEANVSPAHSADVPSPQAAVVREFVSPNELELKPLSVTVAPTALVVPAAAPASAPTSASPPPPSPPVSPPVGEEQFYEPPCMSTRSTKRRLSTSATPSAPALKRAKTAPSMGSGLASPAMDGAAGAEYSEAGAVVAEPVDIDVDGEGDGDGEWVGEPTPPRPKPSRAPRPSSASKDKAVRPPAKTVKNNADLQGLAKLSEEERRYVLLADPLSGTVDSNRVFCTACEKWVKLGEGVRYRVRHWAGHCALVHKRSLEESTNIQLRGVEKAAAAAFDPKWASNVTTASTPAPAASSSVKSKPVSPRRTRAKGPAVENDSEEEVPLRVAVAAKRRKSNGSLAVSARSQHVEPASNVPREDSPLTPMSSPTGAGSSISARVIHPAPTRPAVSPHRAPAPASQVFAAPSYHEPMRSNTFPSTTTTYEYDLYSDAIGSPEEL